MAGPDDNQAELARLRRELLGFVIAEISQRDETNQPNPLAGRIAQAIVDQASAAAQKEVRQSADRLAFAVIESLEPHLAARIPALVEPAVAAAIAAQEKSQPRRMPIWMLGAIMAINLVAIMLTAMVMMPG